MRSRIKPGPKRSGRPPAPRDPVISFRSPPELAARIERFAKAEQKPRSAAIRQLIERGLAEG